MYILGINISHDSSCALIKDGEIIFYHEDERINKIKHHEYPRPGRGRGTLKHLNSCKFYQYESVKKHTNLLDYIIFASYKDPWGSDYEIILDILNGFKDNDIDWKKVIYRENDHHFYHASNAAFFSGFKECACLVSDGAGSFFENRYDFIKREPFREIESIYSFDYSNGLQEKFKHFSQRGDHEKEKLGDFKVETVTPENSGKPQIAEYAYSTSVGCGSLFSVAARSLGLDEEFDAGKVMGFTSYGKKTDQYGKWFFYNRGVGKTHNNLVFELFAEKYFDKRSLDEQKDIIKTLQEETKEHAIFLIEKSLNVCNTNNIVLSGGYFLNCVNNYHYLKAFPDVNFFVDPIAHDGGLSLGAARYLWWDLTRDQTIRKLEHLYLGEKI